MFPLVDPDAPNPLELFQIWLNLPAADKMVDPYFTMLWETDTPHVVAKDDDGRVTEITVIAGEVDGQRAPLPPPNSWAARSEADVAIWNLRFDPGAQWELPPRPGPTTVRTVYVYEGSVTIGEQEITAPTGAVLRPDVAVPMRAGDAGAEVLMLQGGPIGEPVAQYGPFVMNDRPGSSRRSRTTSAPASAAGRSSVTTLCTAWSRAASPAMPTGTWRRSPRRKATRSPPTGRAQDSGRGCRYPSHDFSRHDLRHPGTRFGTPFDAGTRVPELRIGAAPRARRRARRVGVPAAPRARIHAERGVLAHGRSRDPHDLAAGACR